MGYWDVITGQQTWGSFIRSQKQIKGLENALQKQNSLLESVVLVEMAHQRDRQTALKAGLGAVGGELISSVKALRDDVSHRMSGLGMPQSYPV